VIQAPLREFGRESVQDTVMGTRLGLAIALITSWPAFAGADDTKPADPIWVKSVTATSTFADKRDAYAAWLTLIPKTTYVEKTEEYRLDSAWCEGKKDEGIGEAITITFARPTAIPTVTISPGVWKTQKLFDSNNLITGLEVVTDDGRKLTATPAPKREEVTLKLGGAPVSSLVVRITSVKKGKMNDSCISDISFGDELVAVGFDAAAVTALPVALRELSDALWDPPTGKTPCDAKLLAKYLEFPFTFALVENTHARDEKRRFKRYPRTFKTAAAFENDCKKGMWVPGAGLESFIPTGPGKLDVQLMAADASQTMHMLWRNGQWRVAKID
jgi:hypothetical protein